MSSILFAQQAPIHIEIGAADTSNHDISQVVHLWENYLNSNPDSNYTNPYWSESEQRQYNPYDLVPHTWWGTSLYAWLPSAKAQILSVLKREDVFVLRTLLYTSSPKDPGHINIISIIQTGARLEHGEYKLCNVLPINTRHWNKKHIGSVTFICPPEHQFNSALAERMSGFIDSLTVLWHIKPVPVQYYFADNVDRVAKVFGFDYWPAEGNINGARGFTDSKNRIVYAGGSDEWYPHEFVHIYINPLFPNAHSYFHEGYATFVGGSRGHDLAWHLRRNWEYLRDHPEIDVLKFKGVDPYVSAPYVIGGLLCRIADEKGGLPVIQKLMKYGPEDDDLYRAIKETFGVDKDKLNDFLRKKMAEYAEK